MTEQNKVVDWYANVYLEEDKRHQKSRSVGLEFHYTKKFLEPYISADARVLELGCGTGYYGMYFADRCASYTGVDVSADNLAVFQEKIRASGKRNVSAVAGDATDLAGFADGSFDVVLCLGPMYHLQRETRAKVFAACHRVARAGGVIAFAYINRLGVYTGACVIDDRYPNAEVNRLVFEHNTGDDGEGVFFFTSPEEMEEDAVRSGLKVEKNYGLEFLFASSAIDKMSDEQFGYYMEISDKLCESASCVGLANHALLVCKK